MWRAARGLVATRERRTARPRQPRSGFPEKTDFQRTLVPAVCSRRVHEVVLRQMQDTFTPPQVNLLNRNRFRKLKVECLLLLCSLPVRMYGIWAGKRCPASTKMTHSTHNQHKQKRCGWLTQPCNAFRQSFDLHIFPKSRYEI